MPDYRFQSGGSNGRIRAHLQTVGAPVIAYLIDHGWVFDDCGMLNSSTRNIGEGLLVATRELNGAKPVAMPERTRERL